MTGSKIPPGVDPGNPLNATSDNRPPVERLGFSIPEFCAAHGFSVAFYYLLRKQGLTPAEMALGNRRIITVESAAKWRQERTATPVTADI